MTPADMEVKYGYTLRDLDHITHAAMKADRSMAMDYADRRDIAWSAIAEALCEAPHWPKRSTLIQAGLQAIYRAVREQTRHYGYAERAWESGAATAPQFVRYWFPGVTPFPDDQIIEQIAVGQVLNTLTPAYRAAIVALAAHQDYEVAARSLDLRYNTFAVRIRRGRHQLLAAWFEGETPRNTAADRRVGTRAKPLATHCSNGHEWTPENTRIRRQVVGGKLRQSRACRACDLDRSAGQARTTRGAAA